MARYLRAELKLRTTEAMEDPNKHVLSYPEKRQAVFRVLDGESALLVAADTGLRLDILLKWVEKHNKLGDPVDLTWPKLKIPRTTSQIERIKKETLERAKKRRKYNAWLTKQETTEAETRIKKFRRKLF